MSKKFDLVFSDEKGEQLRLSYQVLDEAIPRRWLAVLLGASENNLKLEFKPTGSLLLSEPGIRAQIENGALKVQEKTGRVVLDKNLPMFPKATDLDPILNECREILRKENGGSSSSIETRAIVSDLIDDIARYYSLYDPDHHFHVDFSFKIQPKFFLNAVDFQSFTTDRNDGWVYLAYCQTGTPPLAAFLQKSEVLPNPQNSFDTGFQVIYRDNHIYSDKEKSDAALWTANRFGRKVASPKEAIGQIPLARPLHDRSRDEVLQFLVEFKGSVNVEVFEGASRLNAKSAKQLFSVDDGRLQKFHPYRISGVKTDFVSSTLSEIKGEAWLLLQERERLYQLYYLRGLRLFYDTLQKFYDAVQKLHDLRPMLWRLQFKLTAPVRKITYFANYLAKNHRAIIAAKYSILVHRLSEVKTWTLRKRDSLIDLKVWLTWKILFPATRPFRKISYFLRHLYSKYVSSSGKKDVR